MPAPSLLPPIAVGDKFKTPVADGCAHYVVTRVGVRRANYKLDTSVEHSYTDAVLGESGSAPLKTLATLVAREKHWNKVFEDARKEREEAPIGAVVHYDNGFMNLVRGEIVERPGKAPGFKPLAMVGEWGAHDLPRRTSDGTIYYPHWAKKVVKGEVGDIPGVIVEWGHADRLRGMTLDEVNALEPIDLSVPEMTEEESKKAALFRLATSAINTIRAGLEANDPETGIESAMDMLHWSTGYDPTK